VDLGQSCAIDVFDDPDIAARKHRQGLLRLFRIAMKDQLKQLAKSIPELTRMGMLAVSLMNQESLRDQIVEAALGQACLAEPLPANAEQFEARRLDAKGRIGLLIQEEARLAVATLTEWAALQKKLVSVRSSAKTLHDDIVAGASAFMTAQFLTDHPHSRRGHYPRYLKAASARIDKYRSDPARDARLMQDMAPLVLNYQRMRSALKGQADERLDDFFWMLQELRVALFAQELRTPVPVSVRRLQKTWESLNR